MDIYVVTDGARVVGASTRLQGAELVRANEAERLVFYGIGPDATADERAAAVAAVYDRMVIVNTELQDGDDE
ncbi:hypothetical protein PBI_MICHELLEMYBELL_57 [Mycobacterium phage MichelleMyBell]|uniref:Uncharacterized protein n=1 Tax=Mycobacterium phage MichelleMyBell TaxID=1445726 RepID=W0LNT9_9CAUD|nr:hypothetical protein CH20_gp57 [Mycobacterium phage MichelleMyBell]AHG24378.1 hypothetical protein PBI_MICHELLEMYBELL_57 [Mycobacterium phage MichelleMyBell]